MIKLNDGLALRNLEEQVQKNTIDIARHWEIDRVIADWGITIVGVVNYETELPNSTEYTGEYGDAFAVGISAPYNYFIFTRPSPATGHNSAFWLNVGQLQISGSEGPEGPAGPQGPVGERGSLWYSGSIQPSNNLRTNDMWLNTSNGNVYIYSGSGWSYTGNIIGPQGIQGPIGPQGIQGPIGPQGPEGPAGPTGEFITIAGTLSSSNLLPSPSSVPRQTAYLIPDTMGANHIWLITGTDNLIWTDAGSFGSGGTQVSVNNEIVQNWNADTKLDKITTTGNVRAYIVDGSGNQTTKNVTASSVSGNIPMYDTSGHLITTTNTPTAANQVASKNYVDTKVNTKVNSTSTAYRVYATNSNGVNTTIQYGTQQGANSLIQRDTNGQILTAEVTDPANQTIIPYSQIKNMTDRKLPKKSEPLPNRAKNSQIIVAQGQAADISYNWLDLGDIMYPVGSIVITTKFADNTNKPGFVVSGNNYTHTIFGGTWSLMPNTFLVGAGSNFTIGSTGGYYNSVIPAHNHSGQFTVDSSNLQINAQTIGSGSGNVTALGIANTASGSKGNVITTSTTGESATNTNLPPYTAVYIFKRTA